MIVGRTVKRRVAMTAHLVLSGLGLLLGVIVAWRSGLLQWAVIPAFAIGALWTYSTTLQAAASSSAMGWWPRSTALVPLTVGLYEIPMLNAPIRVADGDHRRMADSSRWNQLLQGTLVLGPGLTLPSPSSAPWCANCRRTWPM